MPYEIKNGNKNKTLYIHKYIVCKSHSNYIHVLTLKYLWSTSDVICYYKHINLYMNLYLSHVHIYIN